MKRRYLLNIAICAPLLGHEGPRTVPHVDEATLVQYASDISYLASSSASWQPSSQGTLGAVSKESPQEKFRRYGTTLYNFVSHYQEIPPEQLSVRQRQLLAGAEYLLALMEIEKLGGFYFPDNGVRRLESLAHRVSANRDTLPMFLGSTFVQKSIGFLNSAIKRHPSSFDNLFAAQFTLALLHSMYHDTLADERAVKLLKNIINQNPPDRAFLNKVRTLLAQVYARTPDQNRFLIKSLIANIRFDAHSNPTYVFPQDLQYAQILDRSLSQPA